MDAASFPKNPDGSEVGISVNVSATQFIEPGILIETVTQALSESGLEPSRLKLEITESAAFSRDKLGVIASLRELGCKIALDDFGTGYSSLTQLNLIPMDYIKLDRSFIKGIGSDDADEDVRCDRLTRAVLGIAQTFGLESIVEGVETEQQCERLRSYGASLIQGYLFSKPLAVEDVRAYMTRYATE